MIRAEHLSKRYSGGADAVRDLSLRVGAGEIYALLGPNGAGKSTTIGCLLGFVEPDAGRVVLGDDAGITAAEAAARHAAYIPEQMALYDRLTGRENVRLFADLSGRPCSDADALALLELAGLGRDDAGRSCSGYSKGMRQKVGIAVALAKQARALVLDEPTSGLDPQAAFEFGRLLSRLAAGGCAVLMATHDLFRAQEIAQRCGLLVGGVLREEFDLASMPPGLLGQVYLDRVRHG